MPADFSGDGRAEIAVFRPSNGGWYIYNLANNQSTSIQFGQAGDVPVAADYDADGKADVAVFRNGVWYIQRSRDGFTGIAFGQTGDKAVPADYDGDGKTDVAVFRPSNGTWYLLQSTNGFAGVQFGFGTDLPVPADYDGDGKADVAVFRDGICAAVVIEAINLPVSSFNSAPPIPLTGAIRMGRGTNSIEWLTARNTIAGASNIETDLASTTTNIRVAHVASTNSQRGLDVRNFGAAMANRTINAEIIDNEFYNNRIGMQGEGLRIAGLQGANGSVINATLAGNRCYYNLLGIIVENNRASNANLTVFSSGDRFYENGNGAFVVAGLSAVSTVANGNTTNFTAYGDSFENNNGFNNFDFGGLVIVAGENTWIPNGVNNNTVNVELRNCRFSNNQIHDIALFGARSMPLSAGLPGTNNRARLRLLGTIVPVLETADSIPETPGGMNSVTVIRSPVTANFDYDRCSTRLIRLTAVTRLI